MCLNVCLYVCICHVEDVFSLSELEYCVLNGSYILSAAFPSNAPNPYAGGGALPLGIADGNGQFGYVTVVMLLEYLFV